MGNGRSSQHPCGAVAHVSLGPDEVETTLTARFDEIVERHADCVAVTECGVETTYAGLARRARAVAEAATAGGLRPGEPTALLLDQGASAVAAILGTLRAGGAFAPLDVLDPPSRAAALVDLVGARLLLASRPRAEQAHEIASAAQGVVHVVVVDDLDVDAGGGGAAVHATPLSPASIFFTSGSTGSPKAVLDLHRNVLHNVLRYTNLLEISPADRISLVQRTSFSGVTSSLFAALLNGATLCTFPLTAERLPALAAWLHRERITIFHAVPAIFRVVVAGGQLFPHVRVVRLEGDRALWRDAELFQRHFAAGATLANGLGTTETGLACQFRVRHETQLEDGILPVGHPAPAMEILVLDEGGRSLPEGETGEIAVRSRFLAQGYIGAPALTAERFLADPEGGDRRVYRTGDLGRIGTAGRVEYLGRLDGTFKVGGVRVEPAEVEAALLRTPGVREAAVIVDASRNGQGRLAASVVADEPGLDATEIRRRLASLLPAVMIPPRITILEQLPLGAHWKLERAAAARVEPSTELERELCAIWAEVLETPVGIDDTFVSLGGDSLSAAEVAATIAARLGLDIPPSLLARSPTVARLAAALDTCDAPEGVGLAVLTDDGDGVPLVLLPDHGGHALMYAAVAAAVDPSHPVWSVEISAACPDLSVPALAERTASMLRHALPDGPYVVGGFCYGALLALETARILRDEGGKVTPVLLGLRPPDVPSLASPDAVARWRHNIGNRQLSLARVRFHLRVVRAAGPRAAVAYLAVRARIAGSDAMRSLWGRARPSALRRAARTFRPVPLQGSATLVLGADLVAMYADNPIDAWAGIADEVALRLVPDVADDHALLEAEAAKLGAVLSDVLASVEAQTVP